MPADTRHAREPAAMPGGHASPDQQDIDVVDDAAIAEQSQHLRGQSAEETDRLLSDVRDRSMSSRIVVSIASSLMAPRHNRSTN